MSRDTGCKCPSTGGRPSEVGDTDWAIWIQASLQIELEDAQRTDVGHPRSLRRVRRSKHIRREPEQYCPLVKGGSVRCLPILEAIPRSAQPTFCNVLWNLQIKMRTSLNSIIRTLWTLSSLSKPHPAASPSKLTLLMRMEEAFGDLPLLNVDHFTISL